MIFSITLLKVLMISLVYSNYRERLFSFISKFRYQKGITPHTKSRKIRCLCGFPAFCLLFKFGKSKDIIKYICLSFISFFAAILFQLHISFRLADFLLPICCHFIVTNSCNLAILLCLFLLQ